MYQWRLIRLLLSPSIFSGLLTSGLALSFLAYFSWQYIQDNKFFYDYLFGIYGVRDYVGQPKDGLAGHIQDFFSSEIVYTILVATVAIVVGVIVYAALRGASLIKSRAEELSGELRYSSEQRGDLVAELITRLCLRIMGVLGWGLYAAFFSSSVVQLALLLTEQGITHLQNDTIFFGGLQLILASITLGGGLHIHVLFLRLCFLRSRVFGGDEQIEEIELGSHLR